MKLFELHEAKQRASLIEALKKHCKHNLSVMYKQNLRLMRGDTGRGQIEDTPDKWWFESKPRTMPRKSQTENNTIMVWTTQADSWDDVPRRAFSNSCTTNYYSAAQFGGSVYLVIPFDNVESYAYCPIDFNYFQHWPSGKNRAPDLLSRLGYLYNIQDSAHRAYLGLANGRSPALQKILSKHKAAVAREMSDITNLEHIWKFSDLLADLMEYFAGPPNRDAHELETELHDNIIDYIDDFGMPPAAWLKKYVTPKAMNVTVHDSLEALPKDMSEAPEIWFEGQFIGITDPHNDAWLTNPEESGYLDHLAKLVLG